MKQPGALLVALVLASSAIARGHEGRSPIEHGGAWRATLVTAHEPAPGIRVSVLPGRVPGLLVENSGAEPLLIFGADGEPFLRLSDRGVEANEASPTWRRQVVVRGGALPAAADAASAPRWRHVSEARRFAWIEFRAWPGTDEPPKAFATPDAVPPRWAWSIPARVGERSLRFAGLTTWHATAPRDVLRLAR